jgi:glycerophosphoryl diester phosphodiesterase
MSVPRIIAHRGSSAVCHENTMAAFARAVSNGADAIEFDLRLTRDRQWIIHHDAEVAIVGGRRRIAALTTNDITATTVGPSADRIPSLTELLVWAEGRPISLVFDIKDRDGLAELVSAVGVGAPGNAVFSSFHRPILSALASLRPDWPRALIIGDLGGALIRRLAFRSILRWARTHRLAALHLQERWVTPTVISQVRDAGLKLAIWTVDDPLRMTLLAALGVDAIITNRPDTGRAIIRQVAGAGPGVAH